MNTTYSFIAGTPGIGNWIAGLFHLKKG